MPVRLRTFEPSDLPAIQALHTQSDSTPTVDRAATQNKDADHEEVLQRFVAEEQDGLVGYSYVSRSAWHPPGAYQSEVFVAPAARRRGIGSDLSIRAATWAEAAGAAQLTTWVRGQEPGFLHFAMRRGFQEVQRFVTMTLEVSRVEDGAMERFIARARQAGISLFSFDETGHTPEARRKLYELNRRLAPLLPGNGDDFPSFEEYEREIIDASWFRPEGQLIAADGENWVGLAGLGFYDEGRRLHHEFTALDPAYQGRGIALALKAWSVQKARAWGVHELRTGNDASNTAIIGVNRRLGYHLQPDVVKLSRSLGSGP